MFCVNCGIKLVGQFCAGCGTPATAVAETQEIIAIGDWQHEVLYDVLLRFHEVRMRLAGVRESGTTITGEAWMELYDKAFKPFTGVSVQTIAKIAAPLYAKMGIKTGKKRINVFTEPPGKIIVDVLCALARNGLPLVKVHQGQSGCVIEAKLPSDLWAFEGQIVVAVDGTGAETKVEAATNIPGQLFDWGKSTRCLEKLFSDLGTKAVDKRVA